MDNVEEANNILGVPIYKKESIDEINEIIDKPNMEIKGKKSFKSYLLLGLLFIILIAIVIIINI